MRAPLWPPLAQQLSTALLTRLYRAYMCSVQQSKEQTLPARVAAG